MPVQPRDPGRADSPANLKSVRADTSRVGAVLLCLLVAGTSTLHLRRRGRALRGRQSGPTWRRRRRRRCNSARHGSCGPCGPENLNDSEKVTVARFRVSAPPGPCRPTRRRAFPGPGSWPTPPAGGLGAYTWDRTAQCFSLLVGSESGSGSAPAPPGHGHFSARPTPPAGRQRRLESCG